MITLHCSSCGKIVSTPVSSDIVVRAYIECPECIKKGESMIIKIGEPIEFGGEKFIIVNVKREDTMEGKVLWLTAYDPSMADKEQQKNIKTEQMQEGIVDTLNKLLKKGEGGISGFGIGG